MTPDAIRFYQRLGLLAAQSKTSSGYRLYSDESVRRLAFIRHAQRCGFSLSEVREVLACDGQHAKAYALAIEKKAQIERSIDDLRSMAAVLAVFIADCANAATPRRWEAAESPLVDALADRMAGAQRATPPRADGHAAVPHVVAN